MTICVKLQMQAMFGGAGVNEMFPPQPLTVGHHQSASLVSLGPGGYSVPTVVPLPATIPPPHSSHN